MSRPNTPNNSKGKRKAEDNGSPGNSKKTDTSSTSSDSNSSGSTTPRATPRTIPVIVDTAASSSPTPTPGPSRGGVPRPMPPIDHIVELPGFNALPSADSGSGPSSSACSGSASSPAPVSLDSIFAHLQKRFTELTKQQEQLVSQNHNSQLLSSIASATQKNADEATEKNKWESEKTQQQKHVNDAKWNAAVEVEKDNEEEKKRLEEEGKRLEAVEAELVEREADLERREAGLQRRQAVLQRYTSDNLEAQFAAVGLYGGMQHTLHPESNDGDLSSSSNLLQHDSSAMFAPAIDDPPRGRALTSPRFPEEQLFSTIPSDLAFHSRNNRFSPIRPQPVIPRRGSSANLSIATPTPRRLPRGLDMERIAAFGVTTDDVYDSSGEEEATQSSVGEEDQVEVEAAEDERPRGRSVRRVSRSENLRREA